MSKPHYGWWGYVKDIIRRYPKGDVTPDELSAVEAAVEITKQLPNGFDRMKVIELVLWRGTHKVPGAALLVPCSERTAAQWHGDFIKEVAKNFECKGLSAPVIKCKKTPRKKCKFVAEEAKKR